MPKYSKIKFPELCSNKQIKTLYKEAGLTPVTVKTFSQYCRAAARLYTWIPIKELWKIIDSQNPKKYDVQKFKDFIQIYLRKGDRTVVLLHPKNLQGKQISGDEDAFEFELFHHDYVCSCADNYYLSQSDDPEDFPLYHKTIEERIHFARDFLRDLPFYEYSKTEYMESVADMDSAMVVENHEIDRLASLVCLSGAMLQHAIQSLRAATYGALFAGRSPKQFCDVTCCNTKEYLDKKNFLSKHFDYENEAGNIWYYSNNPAFHGQNMEYVLKWVADRNDLEAEDLMYWDLLPMDLEKMVSEIKEAKRLMQVFDDPLNEQALVRLGQTIGRYQEKKDRSSAHQKTPVTSTKIGRNAPCPCGSGKKYKNCCGKNK